MKANVPGADVARTIRSVKNRCEGDFVVVARCTKGCNAARALICV